MQLKSNSSMLSLTKSIDMASTTSTLSIKTNIERTASGRFVVKKANSLEDEYSSEAISSCSDNDEKLFASIKSASEQCQNSSVDDIAFDDETCDDDSDRDSMLDNFDVTLVDDADCYSPKNDAERMFYEVVEVLRYEQEVKDSWLLWIRSRIRVLAYQRISYKLETFYVQGRVASSLRQFKIFHVFKIKLTHS